MSVGNAPIICDECGAVKGDANKWLSGGENKDGIPVLRIGNLSPNSGSLKRLDWCSEKCTHAAVAKT